MTGTKQHEGKRRCMGCGATVDLAKIEDRGEDGKKIDPKHALHGPYAFICLDPVLARRGVRS